VNEYDKVMTENFTERFVSHGNVGLASEAVAKLPLHRAESGFDVRSFVVMLQKFGTPELKVVVHLRPRSGARRRGLLPRADRFLALPIQASR
jgi:hypothetical protein